MRATQQRVLALAVLSLACASGFAQAAPWIAEKKDLILRITSFFENGTTDFQYGYAENLGDGRGITFGFFGMTSGTYEGAGFLKTYRFFSPGNRLEKYIPAFERIDALEHDEAGLCDDVEGLDGFIEDFAACADDPAFAEAQRSLCDFLYWDRAVELHAALGAALPITLGQLYDACVQHGVEGCRAIVRKAGGTIAEKGGEAAEIAWLKRFMKARKAVLRSSGPVWRRSLDRVACYERLLAAGGIRLDTPLRATAFGSPFVVGE